MISLQKLLRNAGFMGLGEEYAETMEYACSYPHSLLRQKQINQLRIVMRATNQIGWGEREKQGRGVNYVMFFHRLLCRENFSCH